MPEEFISAVIRPVEGTIEPSASAGMPGLPREFEWGAQRLRIAHVLRTWKETGPCDHGSSDRYVRKHWFEVVTETGDRMRIYLERQARRGAARHWVLYTIEKGAV